MNQEPPTVDAPMHVQDLYERDAACDRFEDAWKEGRAPRIEDYLVGCPAEVRPTLLRELLKLDEHYRREDYRRRFPEFDAATAEPDASSAAERYSLVRFHALGGMGRVSIYHDRVMNRHIAVKELHPHHIENVGTMQRFLQEPRVTGRLDHPSIVPVYDIVRPGADRPPFYTMRFVKGRTLSEATAAYHEKRLAGDAVALDLLTLLAAFVTVCQTVAYAHSEGVVHRDLKGLNVVLGDFGEVVVLDWGLAKLLGPSDSEPAEVPAGLPRGEVPDRTLDGTVKGTPGYMAPEQAAGRADQIGPWTDVYGLGAILYEVLTGRPPFTGTTVLEVLTRILNDDPTLPSALVAGVPPALEAACLRALSKAPPDRHGSAAELAMEVQRWLAETAERDRAIRERERFFNLSPDLLCTLGEDLHFRQLNPAWEQLLGWSRAELMSRPYYVLLHPDDRETSLAEAKLFFQGSGRMSGRPLENRHRRKDGSHLWFSWTGSWIEGERLIYCVGRNITEIKDAEFALQRSQERFELAVRGSGDGLWDWDRETGDSYFSPQWKRMIGYEDHEIRHDIEEWKSRLHPDDFDAALAALRSCVDGGQSEYKVEYRMRHKDGSYRWILDRGVAVRSAAGVVTRMAGSHADITVQKQLERELREGERQHLAELARLTTELEAVRELVRGLQ